MINTFAGPSDKGVYSKSVQQTLYQMAGAALKADGSIDNVRCYSLRLIDGLFCSANEIYSPTILIVDHSGDAQHSQPTFPFGEVRHEECGPHWQPRHLLPHRRTPWYDQGEGL